MITWKSATKKSTNRLNNSDLPKWASELMRYFESDDSFEEIAAASLPVAASTCSLSAVSCLVRAPDQILPKGEISQTPKLKWIIQSSCRFRVNFMQRSTLEENKSIDLTFWTERASIRLLFNRHKMYVNSHYKNYQ